MTMYVLIRRIFSQTGWQLPTVVFVYLFTFAIFLPHLCREWSHSSYFDGNKNLLEMVKKAQNKNEVRLARAREYFGSLETYDSATPHNMKLLNENNEDLEFSIGIITMRRTEGGENYYGYLTQVAARLHKLITEDTTFRTKLLFICNIDIKPSSHKELEYLRRFIHVVQRFDDDNDVAYDDQFQKEKDDYSFCMRQATKFRSRFVLLFEDDAIPHSTLFTVLHHVVNGRVLNCSVGREAQPIAPDGNFMLKLYYPEKWQGFGNEFSKILELVGIALLGGACSYMIVFYKVGKSEARRKWAILWVYVLLGSFYVVLIAFTVGRPYLQHLRRISPYGYRVIPAPGCCTQGVLYPTQLARNLAHHLGTVTCNIDFSVDLAIEQYTDRHDLPRLLLEPNIIQHIGMVSTLRANAKVIAEFMD